MTLKAVNDIELAARLSPVVPAAEDEKDVLLRSPALRESSSPKGSTDSAIV